MIRNSILNSIGFDRAISVLSENDNLLESQSAILNQINDFKFDIDSVYFNTDDRGNSYPAVFLKRIELFNIETLKQIADIHKKIWNYKKVLFLYVYSDTEIRIYNCSEKPLIITQNNFDYEKELQNIEIKTFAFSDKQLLQELDQLFSTKAIDTGIIWTLKEAEYLRKKINLQRRVDKYLVESLVKTARQLKDSGLEINFIHKIILRSLFLLYLEDRGATDYEFYSKIKENATSYFDILNDVKATFNLFKKLEDHFNGNVFTIEEDESISLEQLQLIKKCFISGNDDTQQLDLFKDWRLFNFNIIQIELLSEIYENFFFATDPTKKKKTGTFYTPPSLVEFILNEKIPVNKRECEYNIKILDPSCGSGIFLVESFNRLVKRYENKHNEKLTDFNKLKKLLKENIFGIEINRQAIKIAAFSLYLALVDHLDPKTIWQYNRLPYLINDPNDKLLEKKQGNNLFRCDTIEDNPVFEKNVYDLVIGNPPFRTTGLTESIQNYCDKYRFAKEMVLPFLHKATQFAPNGEIALIFNTKVLTNTGRTYQNFRKWLFNECYVEKVYNFSIFRKATGNFGGQLFGGATVPISIVYYRKEEPLKPSEEIVYYAPKTYIKSNVIEGLSIDSTDVKYLPREECQKPNSKIWKIAMWGGMNDWYLIKNIFDRTISLKKYFKNNTNNWESPKVGLHGETQKPDFIPEKVIDTSLIERYYTVEDASKENKRTYRNINKRLFDPPFVLIKKGQYKKQLAASYIDYFSYCTTACYIFNGNVDQKLKKALVSILNSNITTYILFLVSSSWGIEREQIFMEEVLESPALLPLLNEKTLDNIVEVFNKILANKKSKEIFSMFDLEMLEKEINSLLLGDIFSLPLNAENIIKDCLNFNLDLFENKEKSIALYPVLKEQILKYGEKIGAELNDFLDGQDLYTNATIYNINRFTPLMMIKLSFDKSQKEFVESNEYVDEKLKKLDKLLWEEKATNIYFRKKLNYKTGNNIYVIRPNQRRFWSQSMALEDASELILEILNGN